MHLRVAVMSGLHAYFRSGRAQRHVSRSGGLYRYFQATDDPRHARCDSAAPTVEVHEISTDSEVEYVPPKKTRRSHMPSAQAKDTPSAPLAKATDCYAVPIRCITRPGPTEHAAETVARSCFEQGFASWTQLAAIMSALPEDTKTRWKQDKESSRSPPNPS